MQCCLYVFPHPRCGVVRFLTQVFSSPGTLLLPRNSFLLARSTPRASLECPTPKCPGVPNSKTFWGARLPGVPNARGPTPERVPRVPIQNVPAAQPQSLPGMPHPRVSLECPTPDCPRSAQPQSCWSAQPQSISTKKGWLKIYMLLRLRPKGPVSSSEAARVLRFF